MRIKGLVKMKADTNVMQEVNNFRIVLAHQAKMSKHYNDVPSSISSVILVRF